MPGRNDPLELRHCLAEAFGTFALVLVGCGAIVVDALTGGRLGHVGVSLAFGLVITAMIYAVGNVSGAHLNPAVTAGFVAAGRLSFRSGFGYVLSQFAGAAAAAFVLRLLFGTPATLGATFPADWAGLRVALGAEVLFTFLLMAIILNVSTGHMEKGIMAGVAVGGTIAFSALVAGPVSGASLNPARSLGPALAAGAWQAQWIYIVGPVLGAVLASPVCRVLQGQDCCAVRERNAGLPDASKGNSA
jgi:aquaporin Z